MNKLIAGFVAVLVAVLVYDQSRRNATPAPPDTRTCEERGLSTRSDGECYVATTPKVLPATPKPSAPVNEFVNDCGYQKKRVRDERAFYEASAERSVTGEASPTATLRLMLAVADREKACK
jgi:hypothetical protein